MRNNLLYLQSFEIYLELYIGLYRSKFFSGILICLILSLNLFYILGLLVMNSLVFNLKRLYFSFILKPIFTRYRIPR